MLCIVRLRQKNTPLVSQRGIKDDSILFSVNWYPFISWWPFESRLMYQKKQRSSQQIRQAVFSFGDICCSAILFYGFHQELRITEILLHKIIRLHIMHPKICFTKFAWFFSRTLKLIICSFRMNNQHFNFWSSNDIYHVNFLLICFTQSKFLSARIQNPYHRNLLIESFP